MVLFVDHGSKPLILGIAQGAMYVCIGGHGTVKDVTNALMVSHCLAGAVEESTKDIMKPRHMDVRRSRYQEEHTDCLATGGRARLPHCAYTKAFGGSSRGVIDEK